MTQARLTQPLRSVPITGTSLLLRVAPSQYHASVLSCLPFQWLAFLPWHHDDWFPQFPQRARYRVMPTIHRTPLAQPSELACKLFPEGRNAPGFDASLWITTRQHGFGITHLSAPYLPAHWLTFPQRSRPLLLTGAA